MKRTLLLLGCLGAIGCGTSPTQACKDVVATTCKQIFTCYTSSEIDLIKTIFGESESACVTKLTASSNCEREEPCEGGKKYDAAAASTCIADYKALTCEQLKGGTSVASCEKVCK